MLLHKVYHHFLPPPSLLLSPKLSSSFFFSSFPPPLRSPLLLRFRRPIHHKSMKCSSSSGSVASFSENSSGGGGAPSTSPSPPADGLDSGLGAGYRLPPKEIKDIVDAPPLPALSFSPQRDKILFLKRRALPPLEELAKPEEKLAGLRIDGSCNSRSRMSFYTGIAIHALMEDGTLGPEKEVRGFPDGAKINFVS